MRRGARRRRRPPEALAARALAPSELRLNAPVVAIRHRRRRDAAAADDDDDERALFGTAPLVVETGDGRAPTRAAAVIVTLPLGVLQEAPAALFAPPVAAPRRAAWRALGMGLEVPPRKMSSRVRSWSRHNEEQLSQNAPG